MDRRADGSAEWGIVAGVGRIVGAEHRTGFGDNFWNGLEDLFAAGEGHSFWGSVYRGFGLSEGLKKSVDCCEWNFVKYFLAG